MSTAELAPAVEHVFAELRRYVRFGKEDERALASAYSMMEPHFGRIADEFYRRLDEHPHAREVFEDQAQVERLKSTLRDWMRLLFKGPWDDAYYEKRARIGRIHVKIGLSQRYMFGAMNLIRLALIEVANVSTTAVGERDALIAAISKIIDLELAIMLETYREAFVDHVQAVERLEKRELERLLAISRARYDEIVERGDALVTIFDEHGTLSFVNHRCEAMLEKRRDLLLGTNWFDLFIEPNAREAARKTTKRVLEGEPQGALEVGFDAGEERTRFVRWHFTTLPSDAGRIVCALGLDVTEERELLQRTSRAEHLAGLGTMAAGLAHEIRNPLNAAHLQLTLMQRRLARLEGEELSVVRDAASLVSGEIKRLAALVEQFLQFARPQPLQLAQSDLRESAATVVTLLRPEADEQSIKIELVGGAPVYAEVDDERIKQVLLNLVRNALEALSESATKDASVRLSVESDGQEARIRVEDNGPGLPSGNAPIFQPFFTTKKAGTGLGLSIVHRIVLQHGGDIAVDSRRGRTTFTVSLPVGAGVAQATAS